MQRVPDQDYTQVLGRYPVAGFGGGFYGHFIVPQHHSQLHWQEHGGGQGVGIGSQKVHLIEKADCGGIRLADSKAVSVRHIGQIQYAGPLLFDAAASVGGGPGSGDIGVHSTAREVFPDFFDDQYICFRYQDTGHQALRVFQKSRFLLGDFLIPKYHDPVGFVVCVFNGPYAEQHVGMGPYIVAEQWNSGGEGPETIFVQAVRSLLFAKADAQHFCQPRFDRATEGTVGLDSVDRHDTIGFVG